jgi:hypothetical protein
MMMVVEESSDGHRRIFARWFVRAIERQVEDGEREKETGVAYMRFDPFHHLVERKYTHRLLTRVPVDSNAGTPRKVVAGATSVDSLTLTG